MKTKCSIPKCRSKATEQMLGDHPICRKCADERNRKSRERSALRRSYGHYSPSIKARWSEAKRNRMNPKIKSKRAKANGWPRYYTTNSPLVITGIAGRERIPARRAIALIRAAKKGVWK